MYLNKELKRRPFKTWKFMVGKLLNKRKTFAYLCKYWWYILLKLLHILVLNLHIVLVEKKQYSLLCQFLYAQVCNYRGLSLRCCTDLGRIRTRSNLESKMFLRFQEMIWKQTTEYASSHAPGPHKLYSVSDWERSIDLHDITPGGIA